MRAEWFDMPQGSPEWFEARMGIPTASMFATVASTGGKTRRQYLYQLAGEIITGEPMPSYSNAHMDRGTEREDEARKLYTFQTGREVRQTGFCRVGDGVFRCGASPDGLTEGGLVEIKDALPHIQIDRLLQNRLPPEHRLQVQGQMMVTGQPWCDFVSHCRGLPLLIVSVERDDMAVASLRVDLEQFCLELDALVDKIRSM